MSSLLARFMPAACRSPCIFKRAGRKNPLMSAVVSLSIRHLAYSVHAVSMKSTPGEASVVGSTQTKGSMAGRTEFSSKKFKELVLYLALQSRADKQFGMVKLNKLLYLCDFEAYRVLGHSI